MQVVAIESMNNIRMERRRIGRLLLPVVAAAAGLSGGSTPAIVVVVVVGGVPMIWDICFVQFALRFVFVFVRLAPARSDLDT